MWYNRGIGSVSLSSIFLVLSRLGGMKMEALLMIGLLVAGLVVYGLIVGDGGMTYEEYRRVEYRNEYRSENSTRSHYLDDPLLRKLP